MNYEKMLLERYSYVSNGSKLVYEKVREDTVTVLAIVGRYAMVRAAKGALPCVVDSRHLKPLPAGE